jgi:ABC-type transport system involved in multi-copper enzyme maturation permease subunit
MNAFTRLGHLPLLVKELIEQAARPRTYAARVAYGALLFLIVVLPQAHFFEASSGNIANVLGAGRDLFEALVAVQFVGILLFLPALMCGRITQEKERDSLVLLLLTELSPAQIVLQKYFAGLLPMLTFLLLGLPLAAVAYAFGGFPPRELLLAAVTLLLACLQLGALALWCSALCRNTAGAFIATYAIAALFYLGPLGAAALARSLNPNLFKHPDFAILHVPPVLFGLSHSDSWNVGGIRSGVIVVLTTTLLFLFLAVFHLPRRAFAPPARLGRRFFAWLDRGLQRVNRLLGNVMLGRPALILPGDAPVLWREQRSRLMGRPTYLVRLLIAIEVPVVLLALQLGSPAVGHPYEQIGLSVFAALFGIFGVLVLTVTAANTFVAERANQTIEVLLTTRLPAREIVRQKAHALRGLVLVFIIPMLSIFGYEALLKSAMPAALLPSDKDSVWIYCLCALLTVAIYLPLVSWLALWVGLATRTRLRAIAVAMCMVVGWCFLPFVILGGIQGIDSTDSGSWLFFASPLTVPVANELGDLHGFARTSPWIPVLVNFTLYGIVLHTIRTHCLTYADEYLRR